MPESASDIETVIAQVAQLAAGDRLTIKLSSEDTETLFAWHPDGYHTVTTLAEAERR